MQKLIHYSFFRTTWKETSRDVVLKKEYICFLQKTFRNVDNRAKEVVVLFHPTDQVYSLISVVFQLPMRGKTSESNILKTIDINIINLRGLLAAWTFLN